MAEHDIPMVDLKAQYARIKADIDAAIRKVIDTTTFIKGEDCGWFEKEFAAYCGAGHAVGVANGTDALTLALKAYGVGPGDEVVTIANTFIATGEAILLNGARPVFVDVDPATFTMEAGLVERAITSRTKVILPVHLYGHPADMDAITLVARRHGLPVLEDATHGHARPCRLLQLLPRQEPWGLWRRGDGRHQRRRVRAQGPPDRQPRRRDEQVRQCRPGHEQPARHPAGRDPPRQAPS